MNKAPTRITSKKKFENTPTLFDTFKCNNATVTELRTGIFAPITQVTEASTIYKEFVAAGRVRTIQTEYGEVKITGNILTQTHKDVIDAIFATASFSETTKAGNIALFFSSYEVQSFLGLKSTTNHKWFKKVLGQIKTTNIEFKDKDGNLWDFNFTDSGGYSAKKDAYAIVFTEGYQNFFLDQVTVNYKDELKKLMLVDDSLVKAIIRYFFTHAYNMQIGFDKLLDAVGYPKSEVSIKKARKKCRDSVEDFKNFNIEFNPKTYMFSYSKLQTITHTIPKDKKSLLSK